MVAYSFYEGDNRVRRYAEALARRGDEVEVIALRQQGSPCRARLNGVEIYKIQRRTPNEKGKRDYLLRLLAFFVRSAWTLARRHMATRYDLVHVHSIPDFEVFAALVPKLTGARVILDIHDIVPELYASKFQVSQTSLLFKMLLLVERFSVAFADHVIIANHIWYERIVSRSVSPRKCMVVMNYPDPALFRGLERTRGTDEAFVLLYPGTLSRHQGLDVAIRAIGLLRERLPHVEFHIYGTGTDEPWYRKMVEEEGLENTVRFMGLASIDRVAEIMAQADIGIEPKRAEAFGDEAFSTKIFEFMMVGVPVIASDTTVHRHYITTDLVRYFRSGDAGALAAAIEELHADPKLRQCYVRRGLEFMANYNWEARKHVYLGLADALVTRGGGGRRRGRNLAPECARPGKE